MSSRRSGLGAVGLTLAIAIALPLTPRDGGRERVAPAATAQKAAGQVYADDPIGALTAGRLLVASRRIGDPNFSQTVILLFVYSATDGAAGLIVNRSTPVPVDRLLPDLPVPRGPGSRLFFGGPVGPPEARTLVRMPASPITAPPLLPGMYLLGAETLMRALAEGAIASQLRVYVGYAGWNPGQLEREIRRGDWHVFDGDSDVVFDSNPETVWRRQIALTELIPV